jgi:mannose/fructose/N-acetylgalactosamine-specific phosphotransferase system component IIB
VTEAFAPLLARIDDRLIHGQVVVGCCEPLGARQIVLVDDDVAMDALQQKLYRAGVPPEVQLHFVAIESAGAFIDDLARRGLIDRVVVVVARARTMEQLLEAGVSFRCVQLGGAHAHESTREIVPGVFLDATDRAALRALIRSGTEVFVQPVTSAPSQVLHPGLLGEEGA